MENKFKVGDIVKANKMSNEHYSITCKQNGFIGKVEGVNSMGRIDVRTIACNDLPDRKTLFTNLNPECFDLAGQEIHITVDGDKTIAVLKEGGKVVKRAEAKCNPEDKFDFETGAMLAFGRLLEREPALIGAAVGGFFPFSDKAVKEVNRKAKEGEYIKIVNPEMTFGDYDKGAIFKVKNIEGNGVNVEDYKSLRGEVDNKIHYICDKEYVVLENYEPPKEEEKPAFVPHLLCDGEKYGVIGEPTNYKDVVNRPLAVGDTVDLYDENGGYFGECAVVTKEYLNDGIKAFVMGIEISCNDETGKIEGWKIIKKRSFEEVADGEKVEAIEYIKTEKGR